MNIKCRLQEYKWIKENIQNLEDRLLEIDTKLQHITNELQTDVVQTTKDSDKWTLLIQKKIDIQELINAELANGYKEMKKIEDMIAILPEREKLLMRLRYIDNMKWEQICVEMNYEWRHIHRMHSEALIKITRLKLNVAQNGTK